MTHHAANPSSLIKLGSLLSMVVVSSWLVTGAAQAQVQVEGRFSELALPMAELTALANNAHYQIQLSQDAQLCRQCYDIQVDGKQVRVKGGDGVGLMYASFQLIDQIKLGKVRSDKGEPYLPYRGIKFNIPLDARTPSYDDTGDAAQQNIATMWDMGFWKHFLDNMARNRYNLLTLWSTHPYPSWVKVPEYPEVALEDVAVYNKPITAMTDMQWKGEAIQDPANLTIVKKMTMDEKMAFWQQVFQYADDLGIDVYVFHWNVFVYGAEGKHGIEWKQDSPVTTDYMRQSVKRFLLAYPSVKGIGVTAGEHINRKLTGTYKTENWMWLTYGQGIMDAKAINPAIDVRFIFRRHWSDLDDIRTAFKEYDGPFETSFKYSRARMYSSVNPPWFDRIYKETVEKSGIKVWLNVRNDDLFSLRWGDPDYANQYIKNMPKALTPGFYMGPDGYVWGKEFISKDPKLAGQYEVDKHWYRFKIWGQSGYNPNLDQAFWQDQLALRFPNVDQALLYRTWQASSEVIAWVNKIHFRQNDAQFAPEMCFGAHGNPQKFHSVDDFLSIAAMPDQGVQSIGHFVHQVADDGLTPFQVAQKLRAAATLLLSGAQQLGKTATDPELKETLHNLEAFGHLAHYYSHKIEGATQVGLFRVTGEPSQKQLAIQSLTAALKDWQAYSLLMDTMYKPQLLARTAMLDPKSVLADVKKDIEIAQSAKLGEVVKVSGDNKLWERDQRKF